jgi:hypothetical protein
VKGLVNNAVGFHEYVGFCFSFDFRVTRQGCAPHHSTKVLTRLIQFSVGVNET